MPEQQLFPPPKNFSQGAFIRSMAEYDALYAAAAKDPERFWAEQAKRLHWFAPWTKVLDWSNVPFAKWFIGGKTNVAYNCIDRHLDSWRKTKPALFWGGGDSSHISRPYQALLRCLNKLANSLKNPGLKPGGCAVIYMRMVP